MLFWLSLTALFGVTAMSVFAYQRGAQKRLKSTGTLKSVKALPPKEDEPAVERTLETLRIGDVIVDEIERDWLIVGTLLHREENETWWMHHVIDAGESRWFYVRREERVMAMFLTPATDVPDFGRLADGITHRSMPFHLHRRGQAQVSASGDTQDRESENVRYMIYRGPGGAYLNVSERDRGARVSLSGEVSAEGSLFFMPGEGLDDV